MDGTLCANLLVAWADSGPGGERFGTRKTGHVDTDFSQNGGRGNIAHDGQTLEQGHCFLQGTQPIGIRRKRAARPAQACSIISSSAPSARCGNCFSRRFSPSLFYWVPFWTVPLWCLSQLRSGLSLAVPCASFRAHSRHAASAGSRVLASRQQPMPPLLVSADCGTIPLRTAYTTHHADIACSNPGEKRDAL